MLELMFGTKENFVQSVAIIGSMILYAPFLIALIGAFITGFVTRWESVKFPFMFLSPLYWIVKKKDERQAKGHDGSEYVALLVISFMFGWCIFVPLALILWYTPMLAYIVLGAVLGTLYTARFVYTLKSKFDSHLDKLHKVQDKKDYDVKW